MGDVCLKCNGKGYILKSRRGDYVEIKCECPAGKMYPLCPPTARPIKLSVPSSMAPDEAIKACMEFEKVINSSSEEVILEEILQANKVKVVPEYDDQKGSL